MKIAVCNKRTDVVYKHVEMSWEEFKDRNKNPIKTAESQAEYPKLSKTQRDDAKDVGGFVGGALRDGKRTNGSVLERSLLCLDIDATTKEFISNVKTVLVNNSYFIYSTHSHTKSQPRYRLILPFLTPISEDQYPAIARKLAEILGMESFDASTFQANRMMYWSSIPHDGDFEIIENDGKPLDGQAYLDLYDDWKDISSWPMSNHQEKHTNIALKRQQDPTVKRGVIGAFCRAYDIHDAIMMFLTDVYSPSLKDGRYDYIPADSSAGVRVYDDKFAYSHHASDPACDRLLNSFDLVRVHKFGNDKESMSAMQSLALEDSRVKSQLIEDRGSAINDFDGVWTDQLQRGQKTGELINNLHNALVILRHDTKLAGIKWNELSGDIEVMEKTPWGKVGVWKDSDDDRLTVYINDTYGYISPRHIHPAFTEVVNNRMIHPIKDYLNGLPTWDGVERVDTILVEYLAAEDTPYTRAITRKSLCAAYQRIFQPGIKFDCVPVLCGTQGTGKSTLLYKLSRGWFSDDMQVTYMQDKTAAEKLQGNWFIEIAEFTGFRKADVNAVKAFLSRQHDKFRPSYGRRVQTFPRQTIIFGTSNDSSGFLRDTTGNRRFWPVETPGAGKKDMACLTDSEIDQIWAEVKKRCADGETLYLADDLIPEATKKQTDALEHDETEGVIQEFLDMLLPSNWDDMNTHKRREYFVNPDDPTRAVGEVKREMVCILELWCECLNGRPENIKRTNSFSLANSLKRLGWNPTGKALKVPNYGKQKLYKKV